MIGEPYFRGTVLTKYLTAGGRGQWRQEVGVRLGGGRSPWRRHPTRATWCARTCCSSRPVTASCSACSPPMPLPKRRTRCGSGRARVGCIELASRAATCTTSFDTAWRPPRFASVLSSRCPRDPNRLATPQDEAQMERTGTCVCSSSTPAKQFPQLIALADQIVQERRRTRQRVMRRPGRSRPISWRRIDIPIRIDFDEINQHRNFALDPLEDFVSEPSPRTLRVLRQCLDVDAAQPGHPGPHDRRLQGWGIQLCRELLRRPAARRACVGRGLRESGGNS